jgi:hypothetical protein
MSHQQVTIRLRLLVPDYRHHLDVVHVDTLCDARCLIQVTNIVSYRRVSFPQEALVCLEVHNVDFIEPATVQVPSIVEFLATLALWPINDSSGIFCQNNVCGSSGQIQEPT